MPDWTTLLKPELIAPFGIAELHSAWFLPKGWPGKGTTVTLLIPECEMQVVEPGPDGVPVAFINRPQINKSVKRWVRTVCELARDMGASVSFACDTVEQAEQAAKRAGRLLPNHERVALERMYCAATRTRSGLN